MGAGVVEVEEVEGGRGALSSRDKGPLHSACVFTFLSVEA